MTTVQIIPGNFMITDPAWPRYEIRQVLTSDTFSSAAEELDAQFTDTAMGGVPMEWSAVAGFTKRGGILAMPDSDKAALLPTFPADLMVTTVISSFEVLVNNNDRLLISARANDSLTQRVILRIIQSGALILEVRDPVNGNTTSPAVFNVWEPGDELTLQAQGAQLVAMVNGQKVLEWESSVVSAGRVAVNVSPPGTRVEVDSIVVSQI